MFGKFVAVKRNNSALSAALIPEKSTTDDHGFIPFVQVISKDFQMDSSPG